MANAVNEVAGFLRGTAEKKVKDSRSRERRTVNLGKRRRFIIIIFRKTLEGGNRDDVVRSEPRNVHSGV